MADDVLAPCPFCGSSDISIANENYDPCTYKFGHCSCGAKGPERLILADAVAAWNIRALPAGGEGMREALEKCKRRAPDGRHIGWDVPEVMGVLHREMNED